MGQLAYLPYWQVGDQLWQKPSMSKHRAYTGQQIRYDWKYSICNIKTYKTQVVVVQRLLSTERCTNATRSSTFVLATNNAYIRVFLFLKNEDQITDILFKFCIILFCIYASQPWRSFNRGDVNRDQEMLSTTWTIGTSHCMLVFRTHTGCTTWQSNL